MKTLYRKTSQNLLPAIKPYSAPGNYDLYPTHELDPDQIQLGFAALARVMIGQSCIRIDGFAGIFWGQFREALETELKALGKSARFISTDTYLKPEKVINRMIGPFLGGDDPLWGRRSPQKLADFLDLENLQRDACIDSGDRMTVIYGCGASLAHENGLLIYVDLPKNELQYRSRAGVINNLGARSPQSPKLQYKRFYFVDWPVLSRHKRQIAPSIDWFVDAQRPDEPAFTSGLCIRQALQCMGRSVFRTRPWFEPGAWGGQWIQKEIPQLPKEENYAWSFELITPENGLLFSSNGVLLELSFDFLMFQQAESVLGKEGFTYFQTEFPIRFDLLDTFEGGNLSLQCHPHLDFIRTHFGEAFTQDETYYMLDAASDGSVYLGFQNGINPEEFRKALIKSFQESTPFQIERYIQRHPAKRHDFFLIPSGTAHCSGTNGLVLEISATPYIYTFKMYDWLQVDLEGQYRTLNIDRAMANLDFSRQGDVVHQTLISKPKILESGKGYLIEELPTHPDHFYAVRRFTIFEELEISTEDSCLVFNLVEGESVDLHVGDQKRKFHYAETFVVSAAARQLRFRNSGSNPARLIMAYLKKNISGRFAART